MPRLSLTSSSYEYVVRCVTRDSAVIAHALARHYSLTVAKPKERGAGPAAKCSSPTASANRVSCAT